MPFNPAEPQNGENIDADALRNQLNGLNDKINAIPAPAAETDPVVGAVNGLVKADGAGHIAAATPGTDYLTPTGNGSGLTGVLKFGGVGLLASGFGDATYNGVYTQTGTFLGQPLYTNANGRVLFWTNLDNDWQLDDHAHNGRAGDTGKYFALPSDAAPQDATWQPSGGAMPVGSFTLQGVGIVKTDANGNTSAALPGTDYLAPVTTADGTYPVYNDGVTHGQVTGFTVSKGLITAVTVLP